MSYKDRYLKQEAILQKNEVRKMLKERERKRAVEVKLYFYRDVLEQVNHPDLYTLIERRREALIRNGYFTEDREITELGYNKLITHLCKLIKNGK